MTADIDALKAERQLLEDSIQEAELEAQRLERAYRGLRAGGADILALIPARMLWSLAQVHLVNVRSDWYGVRDRLDAAHATVPSQMEAAAL